LLSMEWLSVRANTGKWASAIITTCLLVICLNTTSAMGEDRSDLHNLISANEDTRMDCQDLAFFLVTHNYDAEPKDGYVEVNLQGKILRLVPNGDKPGLCDIRF
jgi:hypothetical protein